MSDKASHDCDRFQVPQDHDRSQPSRMSQTFLHLRDHLTVIISQCDMLEDIFSARTEVMTRIDVIRNAAHRIANAIACQSSLPSEMFAEDRRDSCAERNGRER
jgi:hypothetical protein